MSQMTTHEVASVFFFFSFFFPLFIWPWKGRNGKATETLAFFPSINCNTTADTCYVRASHGTSVLTSEVLELTKMCLKSRITELTFPM